jgi:hypothetical protein
MKKFNQILAFGASHVAGYQLLPVDYSKLQDGKLSLDTVDDASKMLAFPQHLANLLDIPCINYARTGSSDDRSLRLLPEALIQNPNSLVIFAWNTIHRTEFFYPDTGKFTARDRQGYLQVGVQWGDKESWWSRLGRYFEKTNNPLNKLFLKKIFRPTDGINNYKLFNSMTYFEAVCKQYAAEYRHFFISDDIVTDIHLQKELWDAIDKNKLISFGSTSNMGYGSYTSYNDQRNFEKLDQGHYNLEAHKNMAKYIYENLGV